MGSVKSNHNKWLIILAVITLSRIPCTTSVGESMLLHLKGFLCDRIWHMIISSGNTYFSQVKSYFAHLNRKNMGVNFEKGEYPLSAEFPKTPFL